MAKISQTKQARNLLLQEYGNKEWFVGAGIEPRQEGGFIISVRYYSDFNPTIPKEYKGVPVISIPLRQPHVNRHKENSKLK